MTPPEDELGLAARRAREGAGRAQIIAELVARGTSPDLAESLANGALADAGRRTTPRFGWLEIGVGVVVLGVGATLFVVRATQGLGFGLPTAVLVIGGGLLARGLFR